MRAMRELGRSTSFLVPIRYEKAAYFSREPVQGKVLTTNKPIAIVDCTLLIKPIAFYKVLK